jgi:hypothetical protein
MYDEIFCVLSPALERISSVVLQANVARDAIEQPLPACLQRLRKIRFANEGSCRREEIGVAGAKDSRHLAGRSDPSDEDHRDVECRLHRLGERQVLRLGLGRLP